MLRKKTDTSKARLARSQPATHMDTMRMPRIPPHKKPAREASPHPRGRARSHTTTPRTNRERATMTPNNTDQKSAIAATLTILGILALAAATRSCGRNPQKTPTPLPTTAAAQAAKSTALWKKGIEPRSTKEGANR